MTNSVPAGPPAGNPPEPRLDLVVRGVDFVDLQAGFVRVNRAKAETILVTWVRYGDLTAHETALILGRFEG